MGSKLVARDKYLGRTFTSKYGESFKVITYDSNTKITIEYSDGTLAQCDAVNIKKGDPPNANRITTCGRGYTGVGKYPIGVNGVKTPAYIKWQAMLSRAYGKINKSTLCYSDCSVATDWFNFQNFAQWFENEQLKFKPYEGKICLDKDLLNFKSKEYSSKNCCLIPYEVNIAIQLITKIYFDKRRGSYDVKLTRTADGYSRNQCSVGRCSTMEEAIDKYCIEKDKYIARLSDIYSPYLSDIVLDSLNNFDTKKRLQFKGVT